jgi:phosphoglycolate phosphatase-like HAD superfamily hydrolase
MAIRPPDRGPIRAVIFDLDEALLLRAPAWRYAVEEAIVSVTGRRVDASALADEYHTRPWRDALSILVDGAENVSRCEDLSAEMFRRSAMKRLLVHDGLGMALDRLRGGRLEIGAVSRETHPHALKQVQSTGLDRFLAVLSATQPGSPWAVAERLQDCLGFLESAAESCAVVSHNPRDLADAGRTGCHCFLAGWAGAEPGPFPVLGHPSELLEVLLRAP